MPRDDEKLLRQLSLVSFLLSAERPVDTREIQRSVEGYATMKDETFARRFYGDRDDLAAAGILLEQQEDPDDPAGVTYHLPAQNYYLADLHLTDEEQHSLALVLGVLEGRFAYTRPLRIALASLLGGQLRPTEGDRERVRVRLAADEEAAHSGDRLARLDDAVTRSKTVVFEYRTAGGDAGARTLDPFGLFRIAGHWYVVGRDHARDDLRMFRLSRIQGTVQFASKRPRDFTIPDDYQPKDFRSRPPWLLGTAVGTARIRLDAGLSWWVGRTYPGTATPATDGCEGDDVVLDMPYADEAALMGWVLNLADRAELLAPPDLRTRLADVLRDLAAAHVAPHA